MKNKIYLMMMLSVIAGFISCSKDDPIEVEVSNNVVVDATTYTLAKGAYVNYGNDILYGSTPTHFNTEFFTTDGVFKLSTANELEDITGKIAIYVDLYSAGIGSLKADTYTFVSDANDASLTAAQLKTKYENKNVCLYGAIVTGPNATTSLGNNGIDIDVKSGTVTIEGTKPDFKIIYDLVLENNKTVKGSYSSSFALIIN